MHRCRVTWSGSAVVGASTSTFYSTDVSGSLQLALATFFQAIRNRIPSTATVTLASSGDVIESTTGALSGVWTAGTGFSYNGTDAGAFTLGVGPRFVWNTGGVTNGRRVRGAFFMCPSSGSVFGLDGRINSSVLTGFQTAADALVTAASPGFVIWHRPSTGGSDGVAHPVTGATVPSDPSWLTSRRT